MKIFIFTIKIKQKPVALSRDVRRIKICCPRYAGKSKNIQYKNAINAKNWLIVYHLPTNTKKMLKVLSKNAIVTSISVTEGTPFFINLCLMDF